MHLYQLKIDHLIPLLYFAESDKQARQMARKFCKMEGTGLHKLMLRKATAIAAV